MRKQRNIQKTIVDGYSMTPDQEKVYKYLKRQYYPKTPKQVGEATGKSPKEAYRILSGYLRIVGAVQKARHGYYYVTVSRAANNLWQFDRLMKQGKFKY